MLEHSSTGRIYTRDAYAVRRDAHAEVEKLTAGSLPVPFHFSNFKESDFPAKQARSMRNVLVHSYDEVSFERLWDTATQDIPLLGRTVQRYLRDHPRLTS